jgi:ribosomal protein S18 acetylase RimI-like enzyme
VKGLQSATVCWPPFFDQLGQLRKALARAQAPEGPAIGPHRIPSYWSLLNARIQLPSEEMDPTAPIIDVFTERDVTFAVGLATAFGWTIGPHSLKALIAHDPGGCFVARISSQPVGVVTTTCYVSSGWVGYLMVSPHTGRLGLGTLLLEHALHHLDARGLETVRLDADRPGLRIYERHGFVAQFPSRRFRLSGPAHCTSSTAAPLRTRDLQAVAEVDRESFGDDRTRLLWLLFAGAEAAFSVWRAAHLAGYALLIPTNTGVHLGPWVATDSLSATQLLVAAIQQRGARALTVGVPGPNLEAVAMLKRWGFEEEHASLRMARGKLKCGGKPGLVFGVGSGAFG